MAKKVVRKRLPEPIVEKGYIDYLIANDLKKPLLIFLLEQLDDILVRYNHRLNCVEIYITPGRPRYPDDSLEVP